MKVLQLNYVFSFIFLASLTINAQDAKLQKEILNKLNEIHKPTFKTRDSLTTIYKAIYEKIGYTTDTVIKRNLYKKIQELDVVSDKNANKELDNEFGFIKQYPSNPVSLDILHHKVTKREAADKYEVFNSLYSSLTFDLQNSPKGLEMREFLVNFKNSNIGAEAPDFIVKDIRNTTTSLSSYKNSKYVLLTFWNSASKTSAEEMIFLKDIYLKHHQNGVEIVNISIDDNIEILRKAIDYHKIEMFKNIPVIMNDFPLLDAYFVNSIPQKILIDKNGVIIKRWRGSGENIQNEINLTFNTMFKVVANSNVSH
jgi:peroxiredoxin